MPKPLTETKGLTGVTETFSKLNCLKLPEFEDHKKNFLLGMKN